MWSTLGPEKLFGKNGWPVVQSKDGFEATVNQHDPIVPGALKVVGLVHFELSKLKNTGANRGPVHNVLNNTGPAQVLKEPLPQSFRTENS